MLSVNPMQPTPMSRLLHRWILFGLALIPALFHPHSAVLAQPAPHSLSLDEALAQARQQNYTVRQAEADWHIARAEVHQSRAVFLPQASISEVATSTNDPLNAFGFKLKQEIVTQDDFDPTLLNDPGRIDHLATRFEVRQPVLNPDGLLQHRAARNQARAAASGMQRTRHTIDFQVKQRYFALVLARRSLAVIDSSLTAARANRDQACRFFDQGLITRADLLEADVRVLDLESKRTEADFAVHNASDALRYLLGLTDDVTLVPTDELAAPAAILSDIDAQQAVRSRSDMQALRFRMNAARQSLQASRLRFLPRLNVFGSYELSDRNLFGSNGDSWAVGAMLQWDLFSGFQQIGSVERARAEVQKSDIAYEDQTFKNLVEIDAARRSVEQTQQMLALAEAAVAQARENLRIRTDRFAQGLEKTTDVLNAEVMLANQRLTYLETLYRHNVNIFRLELLLEQPLLNR